MACKPELYITFLGMQHDSVLLALADRGVRYFANMTRKYDSAVAEYLSGLGTQIITLETLVTEREKLEVQTTMNARADRIASVFISRAAEQTLEVPVSAARWREIVLDTLSSDRLAQSTNLVCALDRLALEFDVQGTLVFGEVSRESRVILQWSKAAGIPTFHLHHGVNLGPVRNVYARPLCDYVLLYGRRGGDYYADIDFSSDRLVLAGAPFWDRYAEMLNRREEIRRNVREQCGLAVDAPIVTFAVTTFQRATTLIELGISARTLRAFLSGARRALDAGESFTIVVKDRADGGLAEQSLVVEQAREFGLDVLYTGGDPAPLAVASDVLVACDSNMTLEATRCGVATINLWSPNNWIHGPYYAAQDGFLQVRYDEPERLGGYIRRLLDDELFRSENVAAAQATLRDIVYEPDGRAAARCAAFICETIRQRRQSAGNA